MDKSENKKSTLLGFNDKYELMQMMGFKECDGQDFYDYIFPDNENSGEYANHYSKPNAVYLYRPDPNAKKLKRRIMLKDAWENDYIEYVADNRMTLCSGLAYRGMNNKLENAQQMNALVFDIDGVGLAELHTILARMEVGVQVIRSIPVPTFIVLSGAGIHLYYVFDKPITLYPNIKLQLKALKNALTFRIWDYKGTSIYKDIQYQSINQGFRMVGSINDKYGNRVTAFEYGERVSLEYLNQYVDEKSRVDITKPYRPTQMSREEAAEKFPEWYEKVIRKGDKRPKKWDIAGKVHGKDPYALYHWWLNQIDKATGGHRYFYMMNLAIYACKCDVPKKMLREDMKKVFEVLKAIPHKNAYGEVDPLEEDDILTAMEAYSKEYYGFKLEDHIKTSGIEIKRNDRNFQKQEWHLEDIRGKKARMKQRGQAFKAPEGRPPMKDTIAQWQQEHPEGTKAQCKKDTGISYPTIRKWWSNAPVKPKRVSFDYDYLVYDNGKPVALIERNKATNKSKLDAYYEYIKNKSNSDQ